MASGRNGAENLTSRRANDIASLAELLLLEARGRELRLPGLLLLIYCRSPWRNCVAARRSISFSILSVNGGGRRAWSWEPRVWSFRIMVTGREVGVMAAVVEGDWPGGIQQVDLQPRLLIEGGLKALELELIFIGLLWRKLGDQLTLRSELLGLTESLPHSVTFFISRR